MGSQNLKSCVKFSFALGDGKMGGDLSQAFLDCEPPNHDTETSLFY